MTNRFKVILIILVTIIYPLSFVFAQVESAPPVYSRYGWQNEVWNDDDPYAKIRSEVEREFGGKSSLELDERYLSLKSFAKANPNDPLPQFRWAYASWIYKNTSDDFRRILVGIDNSISNDVEMPKTYNWYRLRFLIQTYLYTIPELKRAGERLLKENPKDYDVMFGILQTMDVVDAEERKQVFSYTKTLLDHDPNSSKYWAVSGMMHFGAYIQNRDKEERLIALNHLNKSLELMPTNSSKLPLLKFWISKVEES